MEPFSNELVTILVLISIIWSGLTLIVVLIFLIYFIFTSCSKPRPPTSIHPTRNRSSVESVATENSESIITDEPVSHQPHKNDKRRNSDNSTNITNVHSNSFYDKNKNNQQKIYTYDRTTEMHGYGTHNQSYPKQHRQSIHPISDIRATDRPTPYPPDVLARETIMNKTRFPADNKYNIN